MKFTGRARRGVALVAASTASVLMFAGCSAGSLGSSGEGGEGGEAGATTITLLHRGRPTPRWRARKALVEAFQAANPNITVTTETRPGGSEGDNLVKTRLATGDMADVFIYNNGSLLQAIKPEQNLAPLDDQPWAGQIDELFADVIKGADGKLYGGPWGTAFGGGVLYNIPVYEKLGLEIPKTWDEFMANNEKIKADGSAAPVEQTYGETWTSQLFVLGDYYNVEQAVPNFAADYTANKAKYATTPEALAGFEHIQEVKDKRLPEQGLRLGQAERRDQGGRHRHRGALPAARRPSRANIENVAPGKAKDVGFFALPGDDAPKNGHDGLAGHVGDVHPQVGGGRQARSGQEVHRVRDDPAGL